MTEYKIPICEKCGRVMKGFVPAYAVKVICFFCYNANAGEEDKDTNWKDKK